MNKKIKSILMLSLLLTMSLTSISSAYDGEKPNRSIEHRQERKEKFENALKELKDEGVLSDDDINNIKDYKSDLRAKKKEEKDNKKHKSFIQSMIDDKIITEEQGIKIKEKLGKDK